MKRGDVLYSVVSGILLILIFPVFNLEFLSWVALIPLFMALKGKNPVQSCGLAWTTGIIYFLGVLYWVVNTMINYGHLSVFTSYLILLMLVVYLSFYVALFGFFLGYLDGENGYKKWVIAPFLWTSLEYFRAHVFTGFPWASLGYSQFQSLRLIQLADITGVYGISFCIVLVNVLIFLFMENLFRGKAVSVGEDKGYLPSKKTIALSLTLIFFLLISYSSLRLRDHTRLVKDNGKLLMVSVIQGNIEQDTKWNPEYVRKTVDIYKRLTLKASENRPDLIVWPETAAPFYFQSDKKYAEEILSLAKSVKSHILFGSPGYEFLGKKMRLYNRAYLIGPEEKILGKYDKIHLVPFGEYVPLKKLLPFVDKMVEGIGDFQSGKEYSLLDVSGKRFGVLICFEIIFPENSRRFVKKGAQFLVNITNDAWFGKSSAPYQHISMAVFRAIENRVPIVRAANTGISGFISPTGIITKDTDIFVRTKAEREIILGDGGLTFYSQYGDLFVYLCIIFTLFFFLLKFVMRYKRRRRRLFIKTSE